MFQQHVALSAEQQHIIGIGSVTVGEKHIVAHRDIQSIIITHCVIQSTKQQQERPEPHNKQQRQREKSRRRILSGFFFQKQELNIHQKECRCCHGHRGGPHCQLLEKQKDGHGAQSQLLLVASKQCKRKRQHKQQHAEQEEPFRTQTAGHIRIETQNKTVREQANGA